MIALIIACEIAFWLVLAAGLAARYLLKAPRTGLVLLACIPLIDLILFVATVVHLAAGATAEWAHGLAALYLGYSIAYGRQLVGWADRWAAHFLAGGPRPGKRYGQQLRVWALQDLGRTAVATALAGGLLGLAIVLVGDAQRTAALRAWLGVVVMVFVITAIVDVSDALWPRREKAAPQRRR